MQVPAWFTLLGLFFEIAGVGLLIRDELTPLAARIKQCQSISSRTERWLLRNGGLLARTAVRLSEPAGSGNLCSRILSDEALRLPPSLTWVRRSSNCRRHIRLVNLTRRFRPVA